MEWAQTASKYKKLLRATLNVQRQARNICDIKAAAVPSDLLYDLTEGSEVAHRQLNRLEKGEFRIAVVGLEKSGKSTFINAWLESNLLPTASERCTYTTTQIYSVTNPNDQRLEVIPKTEEHFRQYIEALQQMADTPGADESARNAQADLNTIQQHCSTLEAAVREGYRTYPFLRMGDIASVLQKYVADVSVAHAIEEVRLYTSRLAETDGIVFFDVPGLNSGLGKHLEASRSMLADCDAVICIQNSRNPSLVAHEQRLVDFVREGDEAVGVAGKLFVFAGQIDLQGSAASLEYDIQKIREEWQKRGQLPSDHIVEGSAAAYLLLKGAADEAFCARVGHVTPMRSKLIDIRGLDATCKEEVLLDATGIPHFRARIKRYLNEERAAVLKKRCDAPIRRIMTAAQAIFSWVSSKFSENPDEARRMEANRHNIAFANWWHNEWKKIEASVVGFYNENYNSAQTGEDIPSVRQLRTRYQELISEGITQLPSLQDDFFEDLFKRDSRAAADPVVFNDKWREELYDHDISKFLHDIADRLSLEVIKDCEAFVAYMRRQLWDAQYVQTFMLDEKLLKLQLESGLRALFLRFARPVAEALIRGPLASERRKAIVDNLGIDIELLDAYYKGQEPAYNYLKRYVKYGAALLKNPIVRQVVLHISAGPVAGIGAGDLCTSEVKPEPAKSQEAVKEEVKDDLEALQFYLMEVVFDAAGFAAFLSQELKHLRDKFVSNQATWHGVARNEYEMENPLMLDELPETLKRPLFDIEVSECLRQLRLALEDAKETG